MLGVQLPGARDVRIRPQPTTWRWLDTCCRQPYGREGSAALAAVRAEQAMKPISAKDFIPRAGASVATIGSPSGMAATPRATVVSIMSSGGRPAARPNPPIATAIRRAGA